MSARIVRKMLTCRLRWLVRERRIDREVVRAWYPFRKTALWVSQEDIIIIAPTSNPMVSMIVLSDEANQYSKLRRNWANLFMNEMIRVPSLRHSGFGADMRRPSSRGSTCIKQGHRNPRISLPGSLNVRFGWENQYHHRPCGTSVHVGQAKSKHYITFGTRQCHIC